MARASAAAAKNEDESTPAGDQRPEVVSVFKARTVIGVIVTRQPDGSTTTRNIGAVEAIRKGEAVQGPTLVFDGFIVGPRPTLGHVGVPPQAMLDDDRVLVTCPCGDPWPGSTQDRLSARAPEKAKPRHDNGERVGPGYMTRRQALGIWPDARCQRTQERLAFKIQNPGALAVAHAKSLGEKDPVELERVRAIAEAQALGVQSGSDAKLDAVFAAARASVVKSA